LRDAERPVSTQAFFALDLPLEIVERERTVGGAQLGA
jgi:hypothetical protein